MGLCVFSLPISLVMIERIYTLSYYHHQLGSMNYYPLFRVRLWNSGMHRVSLYILMNSWYGQIASWDIRVLVVFAPNLSLLCHRHAALLPCLIPYWWLTPGIYFFTGIFSVDVCLVGVFPHSVSARRDPCVRVLHPSRWLPPSRENKNRTGGDLALHLSQVRGHLNWRMGLPALLGGNLGCWIF